MNADGSDMRKINNGMQNSGYPQWSKDSTKIFFSSNDGTQNGLYTMNADGSHVLRRMHFEGDLSFSPDNQKIVFAKPLTKNDENSAEIFVANADGSHPVRLTHNSFYDGNPAWSPDGTQIAYHVNKDDLIQLYVMNADGSEAKKISNAPEHEWQHAWSPDGKKLVFTRSRNRKVQRDLWMMNADGSNPTLIAAAPDLDEFINPCFAPDGQRIVFHRIAMSSHLAELWMINVDGSGLTQLTFGGGGWPAWSPDGRKIAFTSKRRTGNSEIYVMDMK